MHMGHSDHVLASWYLALETVSVSDPDVIYNHKWIEYLHIINKCIYNIKTIEQIEEESPQKYTLFYNTEVLILEDIISY